MDSISNIADKSIKGNLDKAIEHCLNVESEPVKKNTANFNSKRYVAVKDIEDYEELKNRARSIKEYSIENLPSLLEKLEKVITDRGGHFYLAKDKYDAQNYIINVCKKHDAKLMVKGKSMTSEEIKLNKALEAEGIEVAETDLAEFILQYADEHPSHIVAPALHFTQDRISKLFKEKFKTDIPLESGEELTKFARDFLRNKFLSADIGFSGANIIEADTGSIALIESEGNIRMSTIAPDVHISLAGVEKVIPNRKDLATLLELIAPSGTGQPLTSYTSVIRPPLQTPSLSFNNKPTGKREFHLVLLDNGRIKMRENPIFRETLYCLRCSACMNVCANFQQVGGHAFGGETYTGGIGAAWEAGIGGLSKAKFSSLCSGCSRCLPQCPVKINIPWLNENLRELLNKENVTDTKSKIRNYLLANYHLLAKYGSQFSFISNFIMQQMSFRYLNEKLLGLSKKREFPEFVSRTFQKSIKKKKFIFNNSKEQKNNKVLFFPDIYTNYMQPKVGEAFISIMDKMGIDIKIGKTISEGRAALSQGNIKIATSQAIEIVNYILPFVEEGYSIVIVEPSVLALFRNDYKKLINNDTAFEKIKKNSFEVIEFIEKIQKENDLLLNSIFDFEKISKKKVFYHSHCQQRSLGVEKPTVRILEQMGVNIKTSEVECCGMAGSFGYKKEFYDISIAVGKNLFNQIEEAEIDQSKRVLLSSGISCRDQISEGMKRKVVHPVVFLTQFLFHKN